MPDSFTSNRDLIQPQVGADSGIWGGLLNNGVMAQLDLILGATQPITVTVADVTLTTTQWNNCAIKLTGALTGNRQLILPFNVNSVTVAVGGLFVVDNQTTGNFTVTVITAAAGSTGVVALQGKRTLLYSDTLNVNYADDAVATSASTLTSLQGYLTPVSNTPIIAADSIAATTLYYTPFLGAEAAIHNGSTIVPYQFSQMPLTLSSSQAALNIYDVFLAYNANSPVIGTGPSWTAGGGSITAGSCARGAGAGSTSISRAVPSGYWVNTNSMSLIYNTGSGNNTITVAAGQGIFLGSIFIDAAAGQITCHRSVGQSRKWAISNAYNRQETILIVTDPTANWPYSISTIRASNGNSANSLTAFSCLAEELVDSIFIQHMGVSFTNPGNAVFSATIQNLIGLNSVTVGSGTQGTARTQLGLGSAVVLSTISDTTPTAAYTLVPSLGINVISCLESLPTNTNSVTGTFYGTEGNMALKTTWHV